MVLEIGIYVSAGLGTDVVLLTSSRTGTVTILGAHGDSRGTALPTKKPSQYTHCALAGETFFPVVLLCQFLVLMGNRFWFYTLMYLEYNTVVVLC